MKKFMLIVVALMLIGGNAYAASWTGSVALQTPLDAMQTPRPHGPYTFNLDITGGIVTLGSPLGQLAASGISYPITGTVDTAGIITIDSGQTGTTTSVVGNMTTVLLDFTFDGSDTGGGTYMTGVTEYGMSMGITYNWTVVPIPGAVWFLLSGLAGIVGLRRRKK